MSPAPRAGGEAGLAGERALVMGLGSFGGGAGAARYLARQGCEVTVTDLRPAAELGPALDSLGGLDVRLRLGAHAEEDFDTAALVVVNPAVPPTSPWIERARSAGARITSEIELLLEAAPARICAVTGTQGKSSTCRMTADLLAAAGMPVRLGGNIGGSLLDDVEEMGSEEVLVLELSSYQLAALSAPDRLGARVEAVGITNVLADHLERHGSLDAYAAAKRRILALLAPGGRAILPAYDERCAGWQPARGERVNLWPAGAPHGGQGLFLEEGLFRHGEECLGRVEDLAVPGRFQRENALMALGLAHTLGAAPDDLARGVGELRGLAHRVEDLGLLGGRRVVDNAVSTTPDSTRSALGAMQRGCVLLAGGKAKGLPLDELARAAADRVGLAVCFGEAGNDLAAALTTAGVPTRRVATVEEAVHTAYAEAPPGAELLFSPACASFDAYPNFQARAHAFRAALPPPDATP